MVMFALASGSESSKYGRQVRGEPESESLPRSEAVSTASPVKALVAEPMANWVCVVTGRPRSTSR